MRKRIYSKRECHVRIARLGHKRLVFDRHSMVIVAAGTVLMGLGVVGMTLHWLFVLKVL
jgi:3-dehydroquinate dehydratase